MVAAPVGYTPGSASSLSLIAIPAPRTFWRSTGGSHPVRRRALVEVDLCAALRAAMDDVPNPRDAGSTMMKNT
ncbi:MAG TPA: hypothetical protein VGP14_09105 [Casimicrobiaceae bacterium]|nr:hypothetical protein [Casimicrobiaceae bacterium]